MKKHEIVCYNEEYATEKLLKIQSYKKECYIINGLCFGDDFNIINCYIVVYYSNKKIEGV